MPILRVVPRSSLPVRDPRLDDSRVRKVLKFTGQGSADITNANQKGLKMGTGDFAVFGLVKMLTTSGYRVLIATADGWQDGLFFARYGNESWRLIVDKGANTSYRQSTTGINDYKWHSILGFCGGNGATVDLYSDGANWNGGSSLGAVGDISNTEPVYIGVLRTYDFYAAPFGHLGRVMVFNLGEGGLTTLKTHHGFASLAAFEADFADRLYKWPYASLADISRPELEMVGAFNVELLSNTGFETAGAGGADVFGSWVEVASDGAIADEATLVQAGSHAAKLTAGASVDTRVYQDITVTPGKMYELSFYDRGDGTYGGRYRIVDVTNANDIISLTATGHTGTTYTKLAVTFIAPAGCTTVRIGLWCPSTDTGVCYFDTVSVHSVGCVADWRWDHPGGIWNDYTVNANHLTPQGSGREIVNFIEPRSGKQLSIGRNRLITPIKGFPPT